MTTIAFTSAKGAPGVTTATLAIASAWSSGMRLVAEVDVDGGDIAAMCGLSLQGNGLLSLSVAGRRGDSTVDALSHCQLFGASQLPILVAPEQPQKVAQSLEMLGARLLSTLEAAEGTVFLDAGRLRPSESTGSVLTQVDLSVLVARPTVAQAAAIQGRGSILSSFGPRIALLVVGDSPYGSEEFGSAVGLDVLGVIADDRRGTEALTQTPDSFATRKSLLMRSATEVARSMQQRLDSMVVSR